MIYNYYRSDCDKFNYVIQSKLNESSEQPNVKVKRRADVKKMTQCQGMIRQILDLYSTILSNSFFLDVHMTSIRSSLFKQQANAPHINTSPGSYSSNSKHETFKSAVINSVPAPIKIITQHPPLIPANNSPNTISSLSSLSRPMQSHSSSNFSPAPSLPPCSIENSIFLMSHPLSCCHWITKIMGELVRCFDEVRSMRVGGGTLVEERVLRIVGDVADSIKKRCVEIICEGLVLGNQYHEN